MQKCLSLMMLKIRSIYQSSTPQKVGFRYLSADSEQMLLKEITKYGVHAEFFTQHMVLARRVFNDLLQIAVDQSVQNQ
jgi:hypothetical protein